MRYVDKQTREKVLKKINCPMCHGSGMYDYGMVWEHSDPGYAVCFNCNGTGVRE